MLRSCAVWVGLAVLCGAASAEEPIGQIKDTAGTVTISHGSANHPAAPGDRVFVQDVVYTAINSAVGITFSDNSMMSLGPSSELALDQFRFNTTTHEGEFDSSLHKGTLAVKSGQIVKQTPEAMKIRTPAAILGVRGTEFVVRADGGKP